MKNRFLPWLYGEQDVMDRMAENVESPDMTRSELKKITRSVEEEYKNRPDVLEAIGRSRSRFRRLYLAVALISCVALTLVLLYTISLMPRYGEENPRTKEVVSRYVEEGLQETGAVNIVSGMILDYRAFDTLGESHVLFTALVCVLILLRIDTKNQMTGYEDYYTVRTDSYFDLSGDPILRLVCAVIIPCVLLYGIYIILNGQNSPGGGFSGGAILGAGFVLFLSAFGFNKTERFMNANTVRIITLVALLVYCLSKCYSFFTGANHLESGIPLGTPGAILSSGLILVLNICVGMVVACTMYSFYALVRRGRI